MRRMSKKQQEELKKLIADSDIGGLWDDNIPAYRNDVLEELVKIAVAASKEDPAEISQIVLRELENMKGRMKWNASELSVGLDWGIICCYLLKE